MAEEQNIKRVSRRISAWFYGVWIGSGLLVALFESGCLPVGSLAGEDMWVYCLQTLGVLLALGWDGLNPALSAGTIDAVIAGQSMTETRLQEVDMAGPYFYASIVCVTKADSPLASATGISQLSGTCTAQTGTIWYDSCLPQIAGAEIMPESETAPAMIMAVESGTVDFICTDMPTALGACATYDDLVVLDFSGTDDDFEVDEGEINIGISVLKGNTALKDAIDAVLADLTADDFNTLMDEAISIQPEV